ncbi:DUF6281 family protein, partial [Nocardioides hankookensis]
HFYQAWSDRLPVARGELLGEATYPDCDDGGGGCSGPAEPTRVWEMRGASPDTLLVGREQGQDGWVVFARLGVDPDDYYRLVNGVWQLRKVPRNG